MSRHFLPLAAVFFLGLSASAHAEFAFGDEISLSGNYLAARSADRDADTGPASEFLARALLLDPKNQMMMERLFGLELSQGNIPAAEELARKVLAFNSQQKLARLTMGVRDVRQHRYSSARKNFTEGAYTPIGELTASLLAAWTRAGEGHLQQALDELKKLDKNEAFQSFKLYHTALISDVLNNSVRAEAAYKQALARNGQALRVVQAYGNFLERHKRRDEAIQLYKDFSKDGDKSPLIEAALREAATGKVPPPFVKDVQAGTAEALFSLGSVMTDDQSLPIALMYTQLGLSLPGDKTMLQTLLGDILGDMKKYELSNKAYAAVSAGSSLAANALLNQAINLQRMEKADDAIAMLNKLVAAEPSNYDALMTLGNIYRIGDKFDKAVDTYTRALAIVANPTKDNWRAFYHRGIAYQQLGDWAKAEPDFRKALSLSADEPLVLNYFGYSMIEKKVNLNEALTMVKKAVELKPNDGMIVDSLGWAYYQLGDYDQAVIEIERAFDMIPYDPIIAEHLGDVYWKVGRKLEAKFQWQHAKDNKPEAKDLARIEEKLKNGMAEGTEAAPPAQNSATPPQQTTPQGSG